VTPTSLKSVFGTDILEGTAALVTNVAVFLASPASTPIHGATLVVDGGTGRGGPELAFGSKTR
jgi:hypothetical protein